MKTQDLLKWTLILLVAVGFALTGCRKDDDEDTDTTRMKETSQDLVTLKAAEDMTTTDVNNVLSLGGSKGPLSLPCNATIDSSFVINDTVTYIITYNGLNCEGTYHRTGTVEAHKALTTNWRDAGAVVYVKYINFKVTRVSDSRWAIVDGVKRYTNTSGGRIIDLGVTATSIVREVCGVLNATYDDNSTRAWNIHRKKTWTGTPGNLILTAEGLGAADGYTNLESWGINRHGDNYYNSVTTPIIFKESCDADACAGGGVIYIPANDLTATVSFGYDGNGQVVDPNGSTCPTHFRVDWTKGNNSGTFYVAL